MYLQMYLITVRKSVLHMNESSQKCEHLKPHKFQNNVDGTWQDLSWKNGTTFFLYRQKWSILRGHNAWPIAVRTLFFFWNYWTLSIIWLICRTLFHKVIRFKGTLCFLKRSDFPLQINVNFGYIFKKSCLAIELLFRFWYVKKES